MASGFKINKAGIRAMAREIEQEFAKNPIRVPLTTDTSGVLTPGASITTYNGPVVTVNGNDAQIAWGNDAVTQTNSRVDTIAPGYEEFARIVTALLANIDQFPLDALAADDARENGELALAEVVKTSPDPGILRRAITMIRGVLAPVAAGLSEAVTDETAEAARKVIDAIGAALPT